MLSAEYAARKWIGINDAAPRIGDRVQVRVAESPTAVSGGYVGECFVEYGPPIAGQLWLIPGTWYQDGWCAQVPDLYVRYWRLK